VIMFILVAAIIVQAVYLRAFTVVPFLFVPIEIVMFYGEFKKQGYIKRYIYRAFKRLYSENVKQNVPYLR